MLKLAKTIKKLKLAKTKGEKCYNYNKTRAKTSKPQNC